jgi:RNA polymerase sigma-70 factor (ECF subfamily)
LLLRIRDVRDVESWRTFVDVYAPLIYRYCRLRGLQDSDAADVGQEVLAQVARSIRSFEYRPERGRFRDWLGALTRHKIARHRKAQGRDGCGVGGDPPAALEHAEAPEADAVWSGEFHARVLEAAMERVRADFEPATWRAFERAWVDDRSAADAARELNLPIGAVYVAKSRVLQRLREEVLALAEDLPEFVPLS